MRETFALAVSPRGQRLVGQASEDEIGPKFQRNAVVANSRFANEARAQELRALLVPFISKRVDPQDVDDVVQNVFVLIDPSNPPADLPGCCSRSRASFDPDGRLQKHGHGAAHGRTTVGRRSHPERETWPASDRAARYDLPMRWVWIAILVGVGGTAQAQAPAPRSVPARELDCKLVDAGKDRLVTKAQLAKLSKGCKVGKGEIAVVFHEGWNGTHLVTVEAWSRRGSVLAPKVRHSTTCGKGGKPIDARAYAVKVTSIKRLEVVPEQINRMCRPDDDDDRPDNP